MSPPSLLHATLEHLAEGLAAGYFSSVELVKAGHRSREELKPPPTPERTVYMARVGQVNGALHAVTEIDRDALAAAASLDEERLRGRVRGPLHGIPVLVKNNIATKADTDNTAGSTLLIGATVPRAAFVVERLRAAGAIVLGKANLTQWANFRSGAVSITGWSAHGGQALAAYHAAQSPGGSSGGSAVAADLGLAWAALGTETDGSILDPAWRNGVVGIKPTVGLTSRDLVIPISERFDAVGPIARTVADAAALLAAIAGGDGRDAYTAEIPEGWRVERPLGPGGCEGVRVGVPWNVIEREVERDPGLRFQADAFRRALADLGAAGAVVVRADFGADAEAQAQIRALEEDVLRADFPAGLAAYFAQLTANPRRLRTLSDVREQTRREPREACPQRDTGIWDRILDDGPGVDPVSAFERLQELAGGPGLPGALEAHDLLAVAMPTCIAHPWAAAAGCPGVTVPMGHYPRAAPVQLKQPPAVGLEMVDTGPGVPMGLCLLGRKWSENDLVRLAHAAVFP
ncbi:putative amidase [Escovopsis weberi]|uniref:Putative amidase n=1 Tax=Escovopsis weberi TaxID=150374 RepID=A0A0M9VT00_ESCWE|nr:putative amidase [Escovopsis weberi]